MQRKLTVILSADVVAYSALMERDEAGTLARLKASRSTVFAPSVAAHGGRIFKLMGDGVLAEFPSAAAAVGCALDIQQATEASEASLPTESRLRYRIGVNLGDVIVDGDDIYGDGVNVAARLQTLAAPGGVAVSRNVHDQVAGKLAAAFDDLGPHAVKNMEAPVHVFAARVAYAPQTAPSADKRRKTSICVLPFANMSGESEQEYFSDGISEDIITDLSKVSALWVAARNTAFTFKGKPVDIQSVVRQLKVDYVLEGSVRKAGGRVRITAQLIDGTGGHVWAERWDRDLNDIFALQDEISEAIVKALKLKILPEEKQAIEHRDTGNAEAYELFLLARQFDRTGSERMKPLIVRLCEKAVSLDAHFARALALLSMTKAELSQRGVPGHSFEEAKAAAERAVALDPKLPEAHAALAEALMRGPQEARDASQQAIEAALALDPNCYDAHVSAGYLALLDRRYDDSIRHFEVAIALDADAYRPAGMVVQAYTGLGDDVGARQAAARSCARCEKLLRVEPDHAGAMGFLISSFADLGEYERAREWTKRAMLFDPENNRLMYNTACGLAVFDPALACELIERIVPKINASWLRWISQDNSLDPMLQYPRFQAILAAIDARLKSLAAAG
jgi:adenylate cyclase